MIPDGVSDVGYFELKAPVVYENAGGHSQETADAKFVSHPEG